ncbi:hypothetical protein PRIPAC_87062 [Pristionchus pacificus]|uniref:Uncharacterized protein n=1 Tax=Pristionchus pacificus TaxID=54126 RepID=A0A2A6BS85_PRIPA|nr:hypothetical protein PRIPAC_87062 [Pristionchus pacificus]|eukprot:PDM68774.1 hypothetical protein PRIPAC_47076 [Pristionchus pacificus]
MNVLLLISFCILCSTCAQKCARLPEAPIPSGITKGEFFERDFEGITTLECMADVRANGLKQGWASAVYGACGATLPIKRWKSRINDDMMYGENLEKNDWCMGMVQDGGQVQFFMWY